MLFGREVQELMSAYPGREWKMAKICQAIIGRHPDSRRRKAVREAVRRVLSELRRTGAVEMTPAPINGGHALYRWRVRDE